MAVLTERERNWLKAMPSWGPELTDEGWTGGWIDGRAIEAKFDELRMERHMDRGKYPLNIEIITCNQWGARKPSQGLQTVSASVRTIFHHTAGHHQEIGGDPIHDRDEAYAYARSIQAYHMSQGWTDSGHNFLIMRTGLILQGRWLTVSAIQAGHMVSSAHCPGQNQQVGIEHEHYGSEKMTKEQRESSANLQAWIAWHYDRKTVLPSDPHSKYFPTSCPANLKNDIAGINKRAQILLNAALSV